MPAALAIFLAVLSTLVLPLPEELALLGAGFWAQQGALPLWAAWIAATAGNVIGDTVTYLIGRYFLQRLLHSRFGKRTVPPDLRQWGEEFVQRNGFRAILLGRFLVALRGPVYLAIGAARIPMVRFELINTILALIEGAALVYLGYLFGQNVHLARELRWAEFAVGLLLLLLLALPTLLKSRLLRRRRSPA
jgi:membrane protein DedA with SNARE-associated domain